MESNTNSNSTISQSQLKRLHVLLNQAGKVEQKAELVLKFSKGRVESSTKLSEPEYRALIEYLEKEVSKEFLKKQRMRKKLFWLCYELGWISGHSHEQRSLNIEIVKGIVAKLGYAKKALDLYTSAELSKLVSQFESIKANNEQAKFNAELKQVCADVGIVFNGLKA